MSDNSTFAPPKGLMNLGVVDFDVKNSDVEPEPIVQPQQLEQVESIFARAVEHPAEALPRLSTAPVPAALPVETVLAPSSPVVVEPVPVAPVSEPIAPEPVVLPPIIEQQPPVDTDVAKAETEEEYEDTDVWVTAPSDLPYAQLLRRSTGDVIALNKAEFKLGRKGSAVDALLSGNLLISGVHAVVRFSRESGWSIEDPGSTNRIRINDLKIVQHEPVPIEDGVVIRLADEYFDFTERSQDDRS
jgi:hypothetical protein